MKKTLSLTLTLGFAIAALLLFAGTGMAGTVDHSGQALYNGVTDFSGSSHDYPFEVAKGFEAVAEAVVAPVPGDPVETVATISNDWPMPAPERFQAKPEGITGSAAGGPAPDEAIKELSNGITDFSGRYNDDPYTAE